MLCILKQEQALYPENFNLNFGSQEVVKLLLYYSYFMSFTLQNILFKKKILFYLFLHLFFVISILKFYERDNYI